MPGFAKAACVEHPHHFALLTSTTTNDINNKKKGQIEC
jgi:hypothetical protein